MFGQGLNAYLAGNAGIKVQLGTSGSSVRGDKTPGVFPELAPDGPTFPYITTMQVSGEPVESMQGLNRLMSARFRLSCYGSSYGQAKTLAEAVRQAFGLTSQYQGAMPDGTILQSASPIPPMEVDDFEGPTHGRVYSTHLEYEFWYINVS